jgi:hypothetical protein
VCKYNNYLTAAVLLKLNHAPAFHTVYTNNYVTQYTKVSVTVTYRISSFSRLMTPFTLVVMTMPVPDMYCSVLFSCFSWYECSLAISHAVRKK